jgi:hypothetical protein
MRRIGYTLFALAGLGVVIALVSLGFAVGGPAGMRTRAVGYGMINIGFAAVNGILGMVSLVVSRQP